MMGMGILSILLGLFGFVSFGLFSYGETNVWLQQHGLLEITIPLILAMCSGAVVTGFLARKKHKILGTIGIIIGVATLVILLLSAILLFFLLITE